MKTMKSISLLLALILCLNAFIPCMSAFADGEEAVMKKFSETTEFAQTQDKEAKLDKNISIKAVTGSGTTTDGFAYRIIDRSYAKITDYTGSVQNVVIPSAINGYPVTSIGDKAFYDCTYLTSIEIPDSVTSIGNYAFYSCTYLTSIEIPDSVTRIGSFAFRSCTSLTGITIPDSVTSIGDRAFMYCRKLMGITLGNSVTSIGDYVFYNCTSLASITIPDSITSIGGYAFRSCTSLTSIEVAENNVNYCDVGGVLFSKDKTVLIQYPIGKTASSYMIPNSVTSIGDSAFFSCNSLTSIKIPDSVMSIGSDAFSHCDSLTSVTLGNSVTSIGNSAFSDCDALTSIEIPDSVMSIGDYAFYCTSLTSITIPNSVTSIGNYAFSDSDSLTSVTLGNSVTSIGYRAFYNCTSLTSIMIPASVASIGKDVFYNTPYNLTIYGVSGSFVEEYANANDISFVAGTMPTFTPTATPTLKPTATPTAYPTATPTLKPTATPTPKPTATPTATPLVTYEPTTEPTVAPTPTTTAVPFNYNIVDRKYAEITEYTGSAEEVVIPSKIGNYPVKSIANYAFSECAALTSVVICDSVTSIGAGAFYNCTALTSVTMGSGVESIGAGAFYNCTALNCVTIPDSVTQISNTAFKNCSNITIYGIEGSYAQTYAETNDIPFVLALKTKSVLYAAYSIEKSINNNGKLPKYVTVDGKKVYMPELLGILAQYAAKAMSDFNSNTLTAGNDVTFAETSYEAITGTKLTKAQYAALAQDVVEYMENNQVAPGSMETEIGTLSFETMLRIFAGVGAYARSEKKFPESIAVSKWVQTLPKPPADGETTEYQYVAFDDILSGANFVQTAFEITSDVPTYVTINGNRLYRGSMLAMFVKTVVGIDQGKESVLPLEEITVPSKVVDETITSCTFTKAEYLNLASRIAKSIDSTGALPKYCTTSYGTINTNNMIYIFARVLDSYKTNGTLPDTVDVQAWATYEF